MEQYFLGINFPIQILMNLNKRHKNVSHVWIPPATLHCQKFHHRIASNRAASHRTEVNS